MKTIEIAPAGKIMIGIVGILVVINTAVYNAVLDTHESEPVPNMAIENAVPSHNPEAITIPVGLRNLNGILGAIIKETKNNRINWCVDNGAKMIFDYEIIDWDSNYSPAQKEYIYDQLKKIQAIGDNKCQKYIGKQYVVTGYIGQIKDYGSSAYICVCDQGIIYTVHVSNTTFSASNYKSGDTISFIGTCSKIERKGTDVTIDNAVECK